MEESRKFMLQIPKDMLEDLFLCVEGEGRSDDISNAQFANLLHGVLEGLFEEYLGESGEFEVRPL